jgi:hypothetical protein
LHRSGHRGQSVFDPPPRTQNRNCPKKGNTLPKTLTVLRIFVASPADVGAERNLLDSVVAELNRTWSNTLEVMLDVVKWETNVAPGFSTDPQAKINEQIDPDYDIFVGIFWGRLGTPTPRAASGTVEEFDRAFANFTSTRSPEILLYFKDAAIAPSKIDPNQLKGVQDFKKSLSEKGGLYWTFDDLASFESSLRSHLSAVAQQIADRLKRPSDSTSTLVKTIPDETVQAEDDYGYFDYLEISETKQAEMTEALGLVTEATLRVGQQLNQRYSDLNNGKPADARSARHFLHRTAADLDSYAQIVQRQVSAISMARVEAYSALSNALALRQDFDTDKADLQTLRDTMAGVIESAFSAETGMRGMRDSADALPRMSKELNKAKRSVVQQLDALLGEIDSTKLTVANIVEAIDKMLRDGEEGTGAS